MESQYHSIAVRFVRVECSAAGEFSEFSFGNTEDVLACLYVVPSRPARGVIGVLFERVRECEASGRTSDFIRANAGIREANATDGLRAPETPIRCVAFSMLASASR